MYQALRELMKEEKAEETKAAEQGSDLSRARKTVSNMAETGGFPG